MNEDNPSKTQGLVMSLTEHMRDVKQKINDNESRLRAVEQETGRNAEKHTNTHDKLDRVIKLCEATQSDIKSTQSDIQSVKITLAVHKTQWKMIGSIGGALGGILTLLGEYIINKLKGEH